MATRERDSDDEYDRSLSGSTSDSDTVNSFIEGCHFASTIIG